MISPWYDGEMPHEDAEEVVHFFMASLADVCPHVSLGETTADTVRYPVGDFRRESASAKIAQWYREYGVIHVQHHPDVWRNIGYHWAPSARARVRREEFKFVTIVAPLLDDLILWPEEILQPMQADTPHNRRSLFRVETLLQALVMRRAVRNYDPRNVQITFDGAPFGGPAGDFLVVDDPEEVVAVDPADREYEEYARLPELRDDRVDSLVYAWRHLRSRSQSSPPPRPAPPLRRRPRPRNR